MQSEWWGWLENEDERGRWWFHHCGMLVLEIKSEDYGDTFALVQGDCDGIPADNLERVSYFRTPNEAMGFVADNLREGVQEWRDAIGQWLAGCGLRSRELFGDELREKEE